MTYTINFSDGRDAVECTDYSSEVTGVLADLFGVDVTIGEAEQDGGVDEDGGQPMRRLVWSTEEEAEKDDGANAVASIKWIA